MQPGRSGVLAVGSEPCQFFHKLFGDGAIPELRVFSKGEAEGFENKTERCDESGSPSIVSFYRELPLPHW